MTLAELETIKKTLQDLIDYWTNQVYSNTAWEAQANAQAIADLQQKKLDKVNDVISQMVPVTTTGGSGEVITDTETPAPSTNKSWMPVLLIAAVAAFFFLKRKRA